MYMTAFKVCPDVLDRHWKGVDAHCDFLYIRAIIVCFHYVQLYTYFATPSAMIKKTYKGRHHASSCSLLPEVYALTSF